MKINIEIDCTPEEAREMLGLPDVKGMQQAWMKKVEEQMLSSVEDFSTDDIMKSWASGASANLSALSRFAEMMTKSGGGFGGLGGLGGTGKSDSSSKK